MNHKVNVGQYVRHHYDTKSDDTHLKDDDIIKHLLKKFNTNFNMLSVTTKKKIRSNIIIIIYQLMMFQTKFADTRPCELVKIYPPLHEGGVDPL